MTEPKPAPQQIDPTDPVPLHSLNEPPGSEVLPPPEQPANLPGQPPETRRAGQPEMPKVSRDPDDIEEELDAEIDDGDIEQKSKKKKK
jgi:hypothetical protein